MEQTAANDPLIGAKVGNYEVRRKLGEGGMGSVYLAEHPQIGKKVALKVLHAEFSSNEDVVTRFFNEAKAVNDIQHPNIVDIIDYGVIPDQDSGGDMVYFIMEFLGGRSLADVIEQEAPIAPERALAISMQIADALGASHQSNIVHRDLKPDNVILIDRGRQADFVKVLDFGIAKLTGDQPGSRRTRTGIVMGTPAYMSPEQCEGKGEVDHRTDVYALGILLYEMLTGRVPFQGEGYGEVLVQHLTQPPQKPSTIRGVIPPHIEAVCLKALEKNPAMRYQTMEEFMQALADPARYVEGHGGVERFTSSNLGAPTPTPPPAMPTPYPPAAPSPAVGQVAPPTPPPGQIAPQTPPPGQIAPQTPPPGQMAPVQGQGPYAASWPGPPQPQPQRSRLPLVLLGAVVLLGLVIGGLVAWRALPSDEDAVAEDATEEDTGVPPEEEGTGEISEGEGEGEGSSAGAVHGEGDGDEGDGAADESAEGEGDRGEGEEAPPEVITVKVTVESKPPGARVFLGDEEEARGTTPLTFEVPKGNEKLQVRLERRGYEAKVKSFVPSYNSGFEVLLKRERRSGRRGGRGGRGGRNQGGDDPKKNEEDSRAGETGLLPLD